MKKEKEHEEVKEELSNLIEITLRLENELNMATIGNKS
tara:strand:+ start:1174 stop:1287 length:114 start_codon:yes stop_codon:yes gene_type:complete